VCWRAWIRHWSGPDYLVNTRPDQPAQGNASTTGSIVKHIASRQVGHRRSNSMSCGRYPSRGATQVRLCSDAVQPPTRPRLVHPHRTATQRHGRGRHDPAVRPGAYLQPNTCAPSVVCQRLRTAVERPDRGVHWASDHGKSSVAPLREQKLSQRLSRHIFIDGEKLRHPWPNRRSRVFPWPSAPRTSAGLRPLSAILADSGQGVWLPAISAGGA